MHVESTQQVHQSRVTSDPVIPAVRGEFYNYTASFSAERPLAFLLKCKANKSRPVEGAEEFPREHDLTFLFGNGVCVCSPNAAPSMELCDAVADRDGLNKTQIAPANITEDAFYELRRQKNGPALAELCRAAVVGHQQAITELGLGTIIAIVTGTGKYGLFCVKEATSSALKVDACHILL